MFQIYEFLPGAVTRTRTMGQSTLSQCAFRAFFFFENTTICKTKGYTWLYWWDLTENNYLCDEINELDWGGGGVTWREWKWKYNLLHLVLSTDYRLTKNFGGMHSEKPSEKKTLRSVPTDSNSVIEWSRFFFYMKACVIWWLETVFYI